MGWLYLIGLGVLVYYLFREPKKSAQAQEPSTDLNKQWVDFIIGYLPFAKSKGEKKLIHKMLSDLAEQGIEVPDFEGKTKAPALSEIESGAVLDQGYDGMNYESSPAGTLFDKPEPKTQKQIEIDNASLLLYFGAFLFVASVGLFIAFGGLPGSMRTLAVLLVAMVMYSGGLWLFKNRPKLEQAGLAFAGIGLATAPFVGLAAYNFIFEHQSASAVWLTTSVICFALYLHALFTLKRSLLNYVLIFTLLSLIESGVSIINAPLYYFGWGLAATGILLVVLAHQKGFGSEFQDASYSSARIFMPIASAASVLLLPQHGAGQLGVSMVLAAAFYATEFLYGRPEDRTENALISHVATLLAVGTLTYAQSPKFSTVAIILLVTEAAQAFAILYGSRTSLLWNNFASIAVASAIAAAVFSVQEPGLLLISVAAALLLSVCVWLRQTRLDAYVLAVIALMSLPLIFGQYFLEPAMHTTAQVGVTLVALLIQWVVVLGWKHPDEAWSQSLKAVYVTSAVATLVVAWFASPAIFFYTTAVIAVSMVLLQEQHKKSDWATASGVLMTLPIVQSVDDRNWFAAATITALILNITLALRYRSEATRWTGTVVWLILPVTLGNGLLGHWNEAGYAWAYLVTTLGLVLARAIARGIIFVSGKVPIASYAQSASNAYVTGYLLTSVISLLASVTDQNSQLHSSLLLTVFIGVYAWLAKVIEKQADLFYVLPILGQALLLSSLRPTASVEWLDLYLLASTVLAVVGYVLTLESTSKNKFTRAATDAFRKGSLLVAGITPISYLFVGTTKLMMPIGLLVFAAMLYHHARKSLQSSKEWIGGLALIAIWWFMAFCGVRNVQAYTHVLAALFALYAYIRHIRGNKETSDQYIIAMLISATVPLILQSLSATAGGVYGWWLLLEQVFFMILGMTIRNPLVTRWGLYVAVGAVLYQLRGLGWAALTVLAIFLIGLAVYKLQKQDDK